MPSLLLVALKTVTAYIFVLILARIMGRKQNSEMTFFNYITGVSLGTLMASLIIGTKYTSVEVAVVLVTLTALTVISGFITLKSGKLRKLIDSEPVIMIANGKILVKNLTKTRMTLSHLQMLLREKNTFNIADVEFALLEPDGKLSVLRKSQKMPVTPYDLNIATPYKGLTADLIMDGQIQTDNLKRINLSESWLMEQLKIRGITAIDGIFYAGLDTSGNLYVSVQN